MTIELYESEIKGLLDLQKKINKLLRKEDPLENQVLLVAFGIIHKIVTNILCRQPPQQQVIISKMGSEFDAVLSEAVKEAGTKDSSNHCSAYEDLLAYIKEREENLTIVFKGTTKKLSDEDVEYYIKHPELNDDVLVICRHCLDREREYEKRRSGAKT